MAQAPILAEPALAAPKVAEVLGDVARAGITRALPATQRRARLQLAAVAAVLDVTLIWLAFCSAYMLRYVIQWVPVERGLVWVPFQDWIPFGLVFTVIECASLIVAGSYRPTLGRDLPDELLDLCRTSLVGVGIISIVTAYLPIKVESRLVIVYAWFLLVALLIVGRVLLYALLARLHGNGWNTRRVVVAGATPVGKMVMQNLLTKRNHGYHLIGFLRESPPSLDEAQADASYTYANFGRFLCLGDVSQIREVVSEQGIDEVIVTLPATNHDDIAAICAHCEQTEVAVKLVPDLFELSLSRVRMDHIAGIPLIDVERRQHSRAARSIKRAADIVLSGLALLILSPLLILIALAIKLDSRGPVLYKEQRVGKGNKRFTFLKFRSMYSNASELLEKLIAEKGMVDPRIFKDRNDPRRTRVGRFIRKLSLDELPQLFNVLRGDMSLVGPRPPLPSEVDNYAPHHFKRLEVIGGITGYWQVSGRSNIESFEEIVIMDTYYIDNWSLSLDIKILLRTFLAVITRNGAY